MDDKFFLLRQLNDGDAETPLTPLPKNIKYQQYTLLVDNTKVGVFIPLRENVAFQETLSEYDNSLTGDEFNTILRKHRGIRNWE